MGALSGFLARNWTLKLSAFGVALLIWVAMRAEAPNRQEIPGIPVQVELADPQWTLMGDPAPASVTVRFGGPSRELIRMAVDRPSLVIPLERVAAGDTVVTLRNSWVRVQDWPGVAVEEIQPATIRLTLEPVERVDVPVALRLEGTLRDHLALAAPPTVTPEAIRVTGPRSLLADLDSARLVPLDLSTVSSSGSVPVALDTRGFEGLQLQPGNASVELRVEDRVERVVSGIPVTLPGALRGSESLQVLPATASVILRGARSIVDRADPTTFTLEVRASAAQLPGPGGSGEFPVVLTGLPPFLTGQALQSVVTVQNRAEPEP